LRPPH